MKKILSPTQNFAFIHNLVAYMFPLMEYIVNVLNKLSTNIDLLDQKSK